MPIRSNIKFVTCPLTWSCGEIVTDTKLTQDADNALSAYNRGDTVINVGGLGQINMFDEPQTPIGELDVSKKIFEFENAGHNRYLLGCKFKLDTYSTSGKTGAVNIKIYYIQHTGAEIELLDASSNDSVFPSSTLYAGDTIHRFETSGTISVPPDPGTSEWHKLRVEYYIPQSVNFDKEFMNDYGVQWLHLKIYGEC